MSSKIHPTAIINPSAEVGEDAEIGAYAVIDGPAQIGHGCRIAHHAMLVGRVEVGPESFIGHGAVIGADPQDLSFDPATDTGVAIGNKTTIRELVTIHRGSKPDAMTTVGEGCFLMAGSHLGHDCQIGNKVIIANNCLLGGHVQIADNVFLGGGSVFHQFIRVGRLAITQGNSGFGKDLPPFTMGVAVNYAAGLNSVGMRRAGIGGEARTEIKEAFRLIFRSGLNVSQALEESGTKSWGAEATEFFQFIREAKKRGIVRFRSDLSEE